MGPEVNPLKWTRPRLGRTAASRWALGGLSIRGLGTRVYQRSSRDDILNRAAELSYYFAFALLPTLLFLTALVGLLPGPNLMSQLMGYADRVLVFGARVGEAIGGFMGLDPLFTLVWKLFQLPVVMLLVLTGLTLVYYLAPAVDRAWSWITPGSAFAVVSWLLMSLGLRFYVGYFNYYNASYGSIGGVILLMLWLYWSGVTLLVGAEIDATIEQAGAERAAESERGVTPLATLPRDA